MQSKATATLAISAAFCAEFKPVRKAGCRIHTLLWQCMNGWRTCQSQVVLIGEHWPTNYVLLLMRIAIIGVLEPTSFKSEHGLRMGCNGVTLVCHFLLAGCILAAGTGSRAVRGYDRPNAQQHL